MPKATGNFLACGWLVVTFAAADHYIIDHVAYDYIDGAAWGLNGVEDLGWHEVAGYFSKPTFGQTYTYLLMNLDTFNGLDEQEQSLLLAQGEALESEIAGVLDELAVEEWARLRELGMHETEFAPEDAERLDELVTEGIWQLGLDKSPEAVAKMREIAESNDMTP